MINLINTAHGTIPRGINQVLVVHIVIELYSIVMLRGDITFANGAIDNAFVSNKFQRKRLKLSFTRFRI